MIQRGTPAVTEKPRVSELNIAGQFVRHFFQSVQSSWPDIRKDLSGVLGEDAATLDGEIAPFEFVIAAIAVQIQALANLLPPDQAARIRDHVIRCLCSDELGTYPSDAIDEYQAAWDESLRMPEPPYHGIASVLYEKLGCSGTTSVGGTVFKSPITIMALGAEIIYFGGPFWKTAVSKYTIYR